MNKHNKTEKRPFEYDTALVFGTILNILLTEGGFRAVNGLLRFLESYIPVDINIHVMVGEDLVRLYGTDSIGHNVVSVYENDACFIVSSRGSVIDISEDISWRNLCTQAGLSGASILDLDTVNAILPEVENKILLIHASSKGMEDFVNEVVRVFMTGYDDIEGRCTIALRHGLTLIVDSDLYPRKVLSDIAMDISNTVMRYPSKTRRKNNDDIA
jgi:hypothetical protein